MLKTSEKINSAGQEFGHYEGQAFVTIGSVMILHKNMEKQSCHAHRPFELIIALDRCFRSSGRNGTLEERARIVLPFERHAILSCEGRLARLYVDLGTRRPPMQSSQSPTVADDDSEEIRSALRRFYSSALCLDDAYRIIRRWRTSWLDRFFGESEIDGRIKEALAFIDGQNVPTVSRLQLARIVNLSPSRFAAVFAREVGMPLRRYVLWRRILLAGRLIKQGDSITRAAMSSGFSDAAHLSRSYRDVFGTSPSQLSKIAVLQPELKCRLGLDE